MTGAHVLARWAGYNNTLYTLSMLRNFRRRFITDFARVEGVPGVYLANQLSSKMVSDPAAMRSADFEKFIQSKARSQSSPLEPCCHLPCVPCYSKT